MGRKSTKVMARMKGVLRSQEDADKLIDAGGRTKTGFGRGLALQVIGGSARWVYTFRIDKRRFSSRTVGDARTMSLDEARDAVVAIKAKVKGERNGGILTQPRPVVSLAPHGDQSATNAPKTTQEAPAELPPNTAFALAAHAWLDAFAPNRSVAFTRQRRQLLDGPHFTDRFRALPCNRITAADIAPLLDYDPRSAEFQDQRKDDWRKKAWALIGAAMRHVGAERPQWSALKFKYHEAKKRQDHHPKMQYGDVPQWFEELKGDNEKAWGSRLIRFITLTTCRRDMARLAQWSEFNLDAPAPTWTLSAERMKSDKPFRLPLSPEAVAILKQCEPGEPNAFVFTNKPGREISETAVDTYFRAVTENYKDEYGERVVLHGQRRTFSDWCDNPGDVPWDVREACLAHVTGADPTKQSQAYGGDRFEKRVGVMARWAKFCTTGALS